MSPWTSLKHFMQNEYLSEKSAGVGFLKRNSARDRFPDQIHLFSKYSLVFVDVELSVSRNGTDGVLLAVAAERLRTVGILAAATVAELLHHGVDIRLENLGELK